MKNILFALCIAFALSACSNKNAKIPSKSPCACYDIVIDMQKDS
ncbi:lipoprotein [Helicobacter sp. MIT 05-5293]|nr:lipoprotein [Helicobacter sp. MIT 05-5293]